MIIYFIASGKNSEVYNFLSFLFLFIQVVAGGGAVEAALSVYLEYLATTLGSREQLAIAEFAEALLIIPKVLYFDCESLRLSVVCEFQICCFLV